MARIRELLTRPWVARAVSRRIDAERLAAFERASGVDLLQIEEGLIAGFALGTVYAAEVPHESAIVVTRFSERMLDPPEPNQSNADLLLVSGVIGRTPQALLTISDRIVLAAVGDPMLARAGQGFALGRLKRTPPALSGAALSELAGLPRLRQAPIRFFASGPFPPDLEAGAHGLLAAATAVAIAAEIADDHVELHCYLSGAWALPEDEERLRRTATDLVESSLGNLFGLRDLPIPVEYSSTPRLLTLRANLASRALVQGLSATLATDVEEILDIPRP